MSQASSKPIPVNIITGALGAGKTTAIARLLADKPVAEFWLVILNEFTDTGIDAVTLASAARGAYDVRMIPGGCLCCTGEEDFRRQLSGVLSLPAAQQPARILIEPSGIGRPGAIIEELRGFERSGALRLQSTVVLIDAQRDWRGLDSVAQAQVDAADVLILSKAELVGETRRQDFLSWAGQLYPLRRLIGCSEGGVLPEQVLAPPAAAFSFEQWTPAVQLLSGHTSHQHDAAVRISERRVQLADAIVHARTHELLGRAACGWAIPGTVLFDLSRLQQLLATDELWQGVERFKAILRTGVERWHLLQRWQQHSAVAECNWSQDSRIEVQLAEGMAMDWLEWDRRWQRLSEPCPIG